MTSLMISLSDLVRLPAALFEMMPVRGRLDLRCSYGAPWRIDQGPGEANEIPYHAVLAGSALLENPAGGRPLQLKAGDILLLSGNRRHVMHDGGGAVPKPARNRVVANLTISENLGSGERLDLCADTSRSPRRTTGCCAITCRRSSS
jgi:AraC family transcriptional activator of mtrCDE